MGEAAADPVVSHPDSAGYSRISALGTKLVCLNLSWFNRTLSGQSKSSDVYKEGGPSQYLDRELHGSGTDDCALRGGGWM